MFRRARPVAARAQKFPRAGTGRENEKREKNRRFMSFSTSGSGCGCEPGRHGTYEGTNTSTYPNKGHGEQKISLVIEQMGSEVNVSFTTVGGGQGKGTGQLTGAVIEKFLLRSNAPDCPGSYEASIKFADDTASWSFKGEDCGGPMEGRGTAKRTKL